MTFEIKNISSKGQDIVSSEYGTLELTEEVLIWRGAFYALEYKVREDEDEEDNVDRLIARRNGKKVYRNFEYRIKKSAISSVVFYYDPEDQYWCLHFTEFNVGRLTFATEEEGRKIHDAICRWAGF